MRKAKSFKGQNTQMKNQNLKPKSNSEKQWHQTFVLLGVVIFLIFFKVFSDFVFVTRDSKSILVDSSLIS